MQRKTHIFDYVNIAKYLLVLLTFIFLNNIEGTVYPYSISAYSAFIAIKINPFLCSSILILSFIIQGELGLLISILITCIVYTSVFYLYKKYKVKHILEYTIYSIFSLIGFIVIGNTTNSITIYKRAIICALIILLNITSLISFNAINKKGIRIQLKKDEYLTFCIFIVCIGLGISNLLSPYIYKSLSIVLILFCAYFFENGLPTITSSIIGLTLSIYYSNISIITIYLVLGIALESLMPLSRRISAVSIILIEYIIQYFFSIYSSFSSLDIIYTAIPCLLFIAIPTRPLQKIKEKISFNNDNHLIRQTINRNRMFLSNQIYEISGIFSEMSNAFRALSKNDISIDNTKKICNKKLVQNICSNCENKERCKRNNNDITNGIKRLIDIAFAKDKVSIIDFPNELSNNCIHPNNIIFALNKYIAEYKTYKLTNKSYEDGRELLKNEADAISEILKGIALESGEVLKYHNEIEKKLSEKMIEEGIETSEILIYGENERTKIGLILTSKELYINDLIRIISNILNKEVVLYEKEIISDEKYYLSFKVASEYDAVFGISKRTKDSSKISGDTYSISKLNNGKFLVAVSDGMGSGQSAATVSSVSLSLIECFYKVGMKSEVILPTVNKLLSLYTEDIFTALDISVVDLYSCSADFIKYGSPYGFIINDSGIKIVEGSSLPLGIINEIKPTVCKTKLFDGDIILIVTDGITDSFGSSGDFIEYLRKTPAKNPQTLTDSIISTAIKINKGLKKDDMTAVAVRIFKK